jgi:hypothetical protein
MKQKKDNVQCSVSFVFETITELDRERILSDIHDIALEIALECEEDGVCTVCTA